MKNTLKFLSLFLLVNFGSQAQCYILFETKQIETATDFYHYNALTGKIVNGSTFGSFDQSCTSYIEFSYIEQDSTDASHGGKIDSIMTDSTHYTYYRITPVLGQGGAVNNQLPYDVMQGLYSKDATEFYMTIYGIGKYNTRNGKLYPYKILPLTQQPYIKKAFGISDLEAETIWNSIKNILP